jgi:hypothetical protein
MPVTGFRRRSAWTSCLPTQLSGFSAASVPDPDRKISDHPRKAHAQPCVGMPQAVRSAAHQTPPSPITSQTVLGADHPVSYPAPYPRQQIGAVARMVMAAAGIDAGSVDLGIDWDPENVVRGYSRDAGVHSTSLPTRGRWEPGGERRLGVVNLSPGSDRPT